MAIKSVYWPDPRIKDDLISVSGEEHKHLKVSRAEVGESVEVFDGEGRVWDGRFEELNRNSTTIRIHDQRTEPPPEVEIILAQALIKNTGFRVGVGKSRRNRRNADHTVSCQTLKRFRDRSRAALEAHHRAGRETIQALPPGASGYCY